MDWNDIDNILFNGTKEEIESLKCPECENNIFVRISVEYQEILIKCEKCGIIIKGHGLHEIPNAYRFFGKEFYSKAKT